MRDVAYPLTIYYDAACPVCSTEMATLRRLDGADRLQVSDCAAAVLDAHCREAGLTATDLGTLIHARDAEGRWLVGVDVFIAAYDAAGLAWISRILAHPWLRRGWDRLYPWVARNRYRLSRLGLSRAFGLLMPRRLPMLRATEARVTCSVDTARPPRTTRS